MYASDAPELHTEKLAGDFADLYSANEQVSLLCNLWHCEFVLEELIERPGMDSLRQKRTLNFGLPLLRLGRRGTGK